MIILNIWILNNLFDNLNIVPIGELDILPENI